MSDREASPDWLREFQAPIQTFVTLSSDSDSDPQISPVRSDNTNDEEANRGIKQEDSVLVDSGEDSPVVKAKKAKTKTLKTEEGVKVNLVDKAKSAKARKVGESPVAKARKLQTPTTKNDNVIKEDPLDANEEGPAEEDIKEKPTGSRDSSRLPLVFPDKVQRSKALIECDGDNIDLSGDVGAVGRIVISKGPTGNNEMLLDLKGTIYKTTIVPSRTFCIVSVGQSEAKVDAIMNDFIQLESQPNVFEAETMIEGTLDGFSFDSDEDGDKIPKSSTHQNDQNTENGDPTNPSSKRKTEKSSGAGQKKAKTAGKATKKGGRKPQAVKKTRKSKK